jgi:hypothetical protein
MFGCDCGTKRYPRPPKSKPFMARAAAKAVSAILQLFTRYSANDLQFPVNDWSLFAGKRHAIRGASRTNGPADEEEPPDSGG